MDPNQELWDRLRSNGHVISDFYVQTGVGPLNARMYVVVDDIAMSFENARALDRGIRTIAGIASSAAHSRT